MAKAVTQILNDPRKAGQMATRKELFGEFNRYAVFAVHTRGEQVCWFVTNAERIDDVTGGPAVIRQAETREMAMAGLADQSSDDWKEAA